MSRIGKKPVTLPKGVKVSIADRKILVEGPKGKLNFTHRPEVKVSADAQSVSVDVDQAMLGSKQVKALWGTTRALIQNMVVGVSQGYERKMQVVGVGWTSAVAGKNLKMNLGFADPVEVPIPAGITVAVEKEIITLTGADKQALGQFASVLRSKRKPEPYNGKGVRYFGENIRKKEGKQVK